MAAPLLSARRAPTGVPWLLALLCAGPLVAQISPGPLSEAHADLDGSANCLQCHETGRGVSATLCYECHEALSAHVAAGRGLHALAGHEDCKSCHIEHQGREFQLVWWGDAGREAFEHASIGYALTGRHADLECASCHRRELIRADAAALAEEADLDHTFLGLSADSCTECHRDPHAGRLGADRCTECHSTAGWKPATGFDHDRTAYPLVGKHRSVGCEECHKPPPGATTSAAADFRGLAYAACTDCHRDPHRSALGGRCSTCHSPAGWTVAASERFDHDRTRYPLRGRHRAVACARCHPGGPTRPLAAFSLCSDCHADEHLGQLAGGSPPRDCAACHVEEGFVPARYPLEQHQRTAFPLAGAHLAIPCTDCHQEVEAARVSRVTGKPPLGRGDSTRIYRFADSSCTACHEDVHRGELARWTADKGCTACHSVQAWQGVTFDHDFTDFPLSGRHVGVACRGCHQRDGAESARFRGIGTACRDCHEDRHGGQLSRECASCHGTQSWKAVLFDHDRDAAFALEGAHRQVACERCHPTETTVGGTLVRYKPIPMRCEDCHGEGYR